MCLSMESIIHSGRRDMLRNGCRIRTNSDTQGAKGDFCVSLVSFQAVNKSLAYLLCVAKYEGAVVEVEEVVFNA